MDVFWTLPPVSRTITAAAVAVSALGYARIISLGTYTYYGRAIFTMKALPQVWRLFTAFLITTAKFGIILDPYLLYQYGSGLERESSRFSQPGDFFVYTAFLSTFIVVTSGYILDAYTFLPALSLAYAYTYAQDNPTRQASFFIVQFETKYLPYALLFMTLVIDSPTHALWQFPGLLAAHLYDFLTRIWPTFGGGRNYIFTPEIVKRWFAPTSGSVQARGYGFAVQGGGRPVGGGVASTGRSTGVNSQWSGTGPGRRLGGD